MDGTSTGRDFFRMALVVQNRVNLYWRKVGAISFILIKGPAILTTRPNRGDGGEGAPSPMQGSLLVVLGFCLLLITDARCTRRGV